MGRAIRTHNFSESLRDGGCGSSSFSARLQSLTTVTDHRVAGVVLGISFMLIVPGALLGPFVFDGVLLEGLPIWAAVLSGVCAMLGLWHFVTAAFALDEDIEFTTSYFQVQDAAALVLPFALFIGTRSVYRRLFTPAYIARWKWQARRDARKRANSSLQVEKVFSATIPHEA